MKRIFGLFAIMGALASCIWAVPVVTFSLTPADGFVQGAAGTSVGWGYTIATDSLFVTIQSFTFGDATPIGLFTTPGVPGTAATSSSPIATSWVQNVSGLQYDIDPGAAVGASTQGLMTLVYDAFNDAELTDQVVFGDSVNAQLNGTDVTAEVFVNGPATIPEPGTMVLLALGGVMMAVFRRRRARG